MYTATNTNNNKDIKNATSNIRDEAIDTAYEVKDDLRGAANQAGRKVRNFFSDAADEIHNVSKTVNKRVHDEPMKASLVALGVGFVLGALFRR